VQAVELGRNHADSRLEIKSLLGWWCGFRRFIREEYEPFLPGRGDRFPSRRQISRVPSRVLASGVDTGSISGIGSGNKR